MADASKVWYKSRGMWAGILTIVSGLYALVQANFAQFHLPQIAQFYPFILTALGALGIFGRVNAQGGITFTDQSGN